MNLQNDRPISQRRKLAVAVGFLCAMVLVFAAESRGLTGQAAQGPNLGQKPPGTTPQIFAPGIVSTPAHEFSCSMTPDGKEFYFTRSGPGRGENLIFVTKWAEGGWTKPEPLAFLEGRMAFEPGVTPDGNLMYFTWNKPVPGQEGPPMNVWCVGRKDGGWSEPFNPGRFLNPNKAMFVTTTLDGTIYTTDISGGPAGTAVAVARIVDGKYEALKRLPAPVNVDAQDMYPHVAPDESYLVFQSRRTSPPSSSGLFVSFRNPDGTWGDPRPIDLGGLRGGLPFVSSDGKYLFFTAGERDKSDIFWVEARFLEELREGKKGGGGGMSAAGPAAVAPAAPAAPADLPHFELTAEVGGGRMLHTRLFGKGTPTVVLVSGFNAPQEYWDTIIGPLAAEASVVTYDRAGIGKSELGTLPAHARQSAADLRRLLDVLKAPKPWLLVGHSLGARIAKLFASMYPGDVGGLVLMDGVPSEILDAQRAILTGADLELLERMTSGQAAPAKPRTEADYSLVSFEQERTMGPLPRVPALVLIAGADREKGVPPGFSPEARQKMAQLGLDLQKKMAADMGAEYIVFDDLGHVMHLEKPEPVVRAIKDMIRKLR